MTDRSVISPDDSALAAEFALGLLEGAERTAFEARLPVEPDLLREVRTWQAQFASIAEDHVAPVTPPALLERQIMQAIGAGPETPSMWSRLGLWQGLTGMMTAVSAVAVGFAVLPALDPPAVPPGTPVLPEGEGIPPGTILMSHLAPTEGANLGLAATLEPSGALQIRRVAGGPTDGRAQEVWLIVGDSAPVSLGLLTELPETTLQPGAEAVRLFRAGAALAISDEPIGGSPTGAPTGAVLAVGTMFAL